MTEALTQLFRRTKKAENLEYLPPYFWHRYWVWRGVVYYMFAVVNIHLADTLLPAGGVTSTLRGVFLSAATMLLLWRVPMQLRKRWAIRELTRLQQKITATLEQGNRPNLEPLELNSKIIYFHSDLQAYLAPSSLSIRRTAWAGDGTRYTIYQRKKPKRVVTFFHDP